MRETRTIISRKPKNDDDGRMYEKLPWKCFGDGALTIISTEIRYTFGIVKIMLGQIFQTFISYIICRGVFRILSNIQNEAFCENTYFRIKLHLRCLTRFWIRPFWLQHILEERRTPVKFWEIIVNNIKIFENACCQST